MCWKSGRNRTIWALYLPDRWLMLLANGGASSKIGTFPTTTQMRTPPMNRIQALRPYDAVCSQNTTSYLVRKVDGQRLYQGSSTQRRTENEFRKPSHPLSATLPGNARTHSPKQIKQIARSIERFGFNNPVLVDDDDQIIAGHGRV